ncbi:MAG: glycosyl transferase [Bacteroidales bacterium]|nr:glycosyl transferase [Bacteroidales bacterium]
MIPKIIHYCWFGRGEMPQLAKDCIASWHQSMPDWEYRLWNEENFDIHSVRYVQEAYEVGKYAFVSDYVRLYALEREGGVYLDIDFEVFKPFDDLLGYRAFAGFEGSKHQPVMMGVCASEPHGAWVREVLDAYKDRHFIIDGKPDLTTIVQFVTRIMATNGFQQDGTEQDYKDLHVFPVDYFSPRLTTGEYRRTENTYCEHLGLNSWAPQASGWKKWIMKLLGPQNMTRLIQLKRKIFN